MKKKLTVLAAILTVIAILSGCGVSGPAATGEPEESVEPAATPEPEGSPDVYDLAYERYAPEEVVLTVNGEPVTWQEYYYWIYTIAYQLQQMTEVDWSADLDGEYTYQGYAQQYAEMTLTQYSVIGQKAAELGLEISAEQQEEIDGIYAEDVEEYGGGDEEAFARYLEDLYIPRYMYDMMNSISVHYLNIFEHYFGEMGRELPDEDVYAYAEEAGYMRAKHILLSTVDDNGEAMSDEEKEAVRVEAQGLLEQLRDLSGGALEEKFDELMFANSADPGLTYNPEGYYFVPGEMVQPFEEAVMASKEGELYPELVESSFGYHIILRLPLEPDAEIDYTGSTLRYVAAAALFNGMAQEWYDAAEVEYADGFTDLDFNELFVEVGE